jgi:hypothetical protein
MPCANTVRSWAVAHPEFGETLRAAFRQARIARRLADRALAEARAAMPKQRESRRVLAYTPELGEAICDRLAEGESLSSIVRDPAMPCYRTVMKWLSRVPEFEEMYIDARDAQADYLFDEARDVALAATPKGVWVSRLQFDVIRWQTARLAPRKYCERLVVAGELAVQNAPPPQKKLIVELVKFITGPNGKVLVAPPRCEKEEQNWVEAYGKPYEGPR